MKHRVDKRIQEASFKDPNNEHLKNQRIKIHQAQISTSQFLFEIDSAAL